MYLKSCGTCWRLDDHHPLERAFKVKRVVSNPEYPWFKEKGYLHFDPPISAKKLYNYRDIFQCPVAVSRHAFYPFIKFEIIKFKYKFNEEQDVRSLDTTGRRELSYCAHLDACILSYYSYKLNLLYEKKLSIYNLEKTVLAFRKIKATNGKGKSNIHFANDAFELIKSFGNSVVYTYDLRSYFDKIDHNLLKIEIEKVLEVDRLPDDYYNIFKTITKRSVVGRAKLIKEFKIPKENALKKMKGQRICSPKDFRRRVRKGGMIEKHTQGIAQGSPISAIFSNIFLLSFDREIKRIIELENGYYFRYCDDILIVMPEKSDLNVDELVEQFTKKYKQEIHPEKKTKSVFKINDGALETDRPLQYLGFIFDGKRKHLRPSSISQNYRKFHYALKQCLQELNKKNKIRERQLLPPKKLYKKSLYEDFTNFGSRNFISYGLRASKIMDSEELRQQVKRLNLKIISKLNEF